MTSPEQRTYLFTVWKRKPSICQTTWRRWCSDVVMFILQYLTTEVL